MGFTLVELMIAIALLAIVAGITVPGLLEAQTRVKVARARQDMHVLSLALEAYHTDNKGYINNVSSTFSPWQMLSTPIAYLGAIPRNPFPGPIKLYNAYDQYSYYGPPYNYGRFLIISAGPDLNYSNIGRLPCFDYYGAPLRDAVVQGTYDPTNGMSSKGDILRPSIQPNADGLP